MKGGGTSRLPHEVADVQKPSWLSPVLGSTARPSEFTNVIVHDIALGDRGGAGLFLDCNDADATLDSFGNSGVLIVPAVTLS